MTPSSSSSSPKGGKPLVRAKSCAGVTYFTSSMKAKGKPAMCIGRRGSVASDVPLKEVLERSARASNGTGKLGFTYLCMGYSQTTAKMERDGALPLCDVGMRLTINRAVAPAKGAATTGGAAAPPSSARPPFDAQAAVTRVGTSVLSFWRRALHNFPIKWLSFNKKLFESMRKQAAFMAKFWSKLAQEAVNWWLSSRPW